jgi:hypothetical protein
VMMALEGRCVDVVVLCVVCCVLCVRGCDVSVGYCDVSVGCCDVSVGCCDDDPKGRQNGVNFQSSYTRTSTRFIPRAPCPPCVTKPHSASLRAESTWQSLTSIAMMLLGSPRIP